MNKKKFIVKSNNLIIYLNNDADPWNDKWTITLKKSDGAQIGWISFEGIKELGTIPISIELEPLYRNRGLGTEALKVMTDWAFAYKNVYEIKTKVNPENDSYISALEKSGYIIRNYSKVEETYSIIKPKTSWRGLYIIIGIIIGFLLGILFGNLWIGFITGILSCFLIGSVMDLNAKKEREAVVGKKE